MIKEQQLKKRLLSSNRLAMEEISEDDPEVSARIKLIEKGKKGFT